jgi:hypothetical protein
MSRRYFTVGEVDRLVPRLEGIFVHVLQLRAAMRAQEQKLERAGVELGSGLGEPPDESDSDEPLDVRHGKAMFRAFYDTLVERLAEVEQLGGEIKDLEIGLVDFLARRRDQDILLCWKLGERQVSYWHPTDSGFRGRRPIDEDVPIEPTPLD